MKSNSTKQNNKKSHILHHLMHKEECSNIKNVINWFFQHSQRPGSPPCLVLTSLIICHLYLDLGLLLNRMHHWRSDLFRDINCNCTAQVLISVKGIIERDSETSNILSKGRVSPQRKRGSMVFDHTPLTLTMIFSLRIPLPPIQYDVNMIKTFQIGFQAKLFFKTMTLNRGAKYITAL